MAEHYYSQKPDVTSNPIYWDFTLRGRAFRFKSDNGVFSKNEVDFGSRLLIEAFHMNTDIKANLLDVGCGYGPIGLSIAASFPETTVEMIDINSRAVELAKENAKTNGISNVVIHESDRFEQVDSYRFAAIVTNPPIRSGKKVVQEIFEHSFKRLMPGGILWVVIQKKQGAPSAIEKLDQLFGNVEVVQKKKGYYILVSKKV
ncbi:class I SAM-dependent methyltransferase [Peribacillus cavernae]|uniref:Class I SAM-dependent methyltransferase n=1 Tax=Peribacillus cavernae TaxID=1674310 RepID=A0A433HGU3_9BACI|nr:class I SAM-dependent methyltransferase [Peribacillus cavernae]MDQ0220545.1 16S rRNA (guanine1207-N2)-methyltransferase [Peribacillus cavernae]RUQ27392.1 class I SAM-dependent methyltransferase [Peribacillus cavernae]